MSDFVIRGLRFNNIIILSVMCTCSNDVVVCIRLNNDKNNVLLYNKKSKIISKRVYLHRRGQYECFTKKRQKKTSY